MFKPNLEGKRVEHSTGTTTTVQRTPKSLQRQGVATTQAIREEGNAFEVLFILPSAKCRCNIGDACTFLNKESKTLFSHNIKELYGRKFRVGFCRAELSSLFEEGSWAAFRSAC